MGRRLAREPATAPLRGRMSATLRTPRLCRRSLPSASNFSATSRCRPRDDSPARPAIRPEFAHAAPPGDRVSKGRSGRWTVPGMRNSPSIRYASFTPPFGYDEEGTAIRRALPRRSRRDARGAGEAALSRCARDGQCDARRASLRGFAASPNAAAVPRCLRRGRARRSRPRISREPRRGDRRNTRSKARIFAASTASTTPTSRARPRLTTQEMRGLALFEDPVKGNCAACHPSRRGSRRLAAAVHGFHL